MRSLPHLGDQSRPRSVRPSQPLPDTGPSPLRSAETGPQGHLAPPPASTAQPSSQRACWQASSGLPQRRILHFLQSSTQVLYNPDTRKSFPESNLYPPSAAHVSGPGAAWPSPRIKDCFLQRLLSLA